MAAAWMTALTGVGPSIASGSQTWSGNCADLPTVPVNNIKAIAPIASGPMALTTCSKLSGVKASLKFSVPNSKVKEDDTQQHDHIGHACGHEGFYRSFIGRDVWDIIRAKMIFARVPEADERVRSEAHQLPADKQQKQIIRNHQDRASPPQKGS